MHNLVIKGIVFIQMMRGVYPYMFPLNLSLEILKTAHFVSTVVLSLCVVLPYM